MSTIRERPILMSAPMIRALLDGSKTQTRRVVKPQPERKGNLVWARGASGQWGPFTMYHDERKRTGWIPLEFPLHCPYGLPGDQLFVRENGWERPERTRKMMREGADTWARYYYDADGLHWQEVEDFKAWGFKRRPSIHMPRWASRIQLEITDVRVERLQEISEADAWAEGCTRGSTDHVGGFFPAEQPDPTGIGMRGWDCARDWYADLWDEINGPGAWDANPWVWALTFKRVKP